MQTFLPLVEFRESARVLDRQRLNKQIVECGQIMDALSGLLVGDLVVGVGAGWHNHPATLMWRGYEDALVNYHNSMVEEWHSRGFTSHNLISISTRYRAPSWQGDERLHSSHRSNLLRKDPAYYGTYGWVEEPGLKYFWPTHHKEYQNVVQG